MKYQDAMIAWTENTAHIRVGPLLHQGDADWTRHPYQYHKTGGATAVALRKCTNPLLRDLMMFIEFNTIVVRDGVPVDAAHKAFLNIDEYRLRISPDIDGAYAQPGDVGGWR